jgi:ABC-type ATPase with predicted acetyltransferase domain
MKFKIDVRFESSVERSPRVIECAEAFGLGLDEKSFTLFDNLELDIEDGDVVYITGQSGSGKSVLLRELSSAYRKLDAWLMDIDDVELQDKPIIDQIGKNTASAIEYLSAAGLNDAYLFIRRPQELSDGQRYRFKIAKLIEAGSKVWIADEFGAVLDRETARVVAFNLQRQARAHGATVIVATTHKDLGDELGADLVIDKRFHDRVSVTSKGDDSG